MATADLIHQMKTDFGQVLSRFQSKAAVTVQLFDARGIIPRFEILLVDFEARRVEGFDWLNPSLPSTTSGCF